LRSGPQCSLASPPPPIVSPLPAPIPFFFFCQIKKIPFEKKGSRVILLSVNSLSLPQISSTSRFELLWIIVFCMDYPRVDEMWALDLQNICSNCYIRATKEEKKTLQKKTETRKKLVMSCTKSLLSAKNHQ
jgi:hypothetical protein